MKTPQPLAHPRKTMSNSTRPEHRAVAMYTIYLDRHFPDDIWVLEEHVIIPEQVLLEVVAEHRLRDGPSEARSKYEEVVDLKHEGVNFAVVREGDCRFEFWGSLGRNVTDIQTPPDSANTAKLAVFVESGG